MRVANWPDVLAAEIEAVRARPFNWDGWSCYDFCAHIVWSLTGVDHREHFPAYHSQAEAEALLAQYGGAVKLTESVLGTAKPLSYARRGDVVVADLWAGLQPAICLGANLTAPGPKGLNYGSMRRAVAAWDI